MKLELTEEQVSFLTIELNLYLRSKTLWIEHQTMVNGIFKQLTDGKDHENVRNNWNGGHYKPVED